MLLPYSLIHPTRLVLLQVFDTTYELRCAHGKDAKIKKKHPAAGTDKSSKLKSPWTEDTVKETKKRTGASKGAGRRVSALGVEGRRNISSRDTSDHRNQSISSADSSDHGNQHRNPLYRASSGNGSTSESGHEDAEVTPPESAIITPMFIVDREEVLQPEESIVNPSWETFVGNSVGVWRGVGAAFSPHTAEMEPIALGKSNEYLYDSRVWNLVERFRPSEADDAKEHVSLQRKVLWNAGNPLGEQNFHSKEENNGSANLSEHEKNNRCQIEDSNTIDGDVMEEDILGKEAGLIFFEDGSYSRGPTELLDGSADYYNTPTFKIEQCLVRGGHSRLHVVHTIMVENKGENIQIMRIAIRQEEWIGPSSSLNISLTGHTIDSFSERPRAMPAQMDGSCNVFEACAMVVEASKSLIYTCREARKRKIFPKACASDDDANILWLTGGVFTYLDIGKDGNLTIGVGWAADDVVLIIERIYAPTGMLRRVCLQTELRSKQSRRI